MKKFKFILVVLLSWLCLDCQTKPSPGQLELVLNASWRSYRKHFITADGQVKVPEQGGGTISEAQAYALLRAVWARDAGTFVRVYDWTYRHLGQAAGPGDSLLAWRWGRLPDGSWGVLDANSAADADLDYALALILAHRQGWRAPPGLPAYLEESRRVQAAIVAKEVVRLADGQLLLTPGNWHEPDPPYLVNPSYFSPAAYQLFAHMGKGRLEAATWRRLDQSTYPFLTKVGQRLGDQRGVGLFPDWCQVNAEGRISPAPGKDTNFGWEAVRVPFRVALDSLWFNRPQAVRLLKDRFLPFFKSRWQAHHRLLAVYHYDGTPAVNYESPVLYAGVLAGALGAGDKDFARKMALKILTCYRADDRQAYFEAPDNYYANNWAWLGLALYAGWVEPGS
ncbi:MAG: glycosyl hydrolase family 8 [Deltaproteobacteria bacterium]